MSGPAHSDLDLTDDDRRQFAEAIGRAFPDDEQLSQALSFTLGVNLRDIVGPNDKRNVRNFHIVEWAQSAGRVEELIAKLRIENPGNRELRAFARHKVFFEVEPEEIGALGKLLTQTEWTETMLWHLALQSSPTSLQPTAPGRRTIDLLIALAQLEATLGKVHPLLDFIERVANDARAAGMQQRLRHWVDMVMTRHKWPLEQLVACREIILRRNLLPAGPRFLLIRVEECGDRYEVRAWLMRGAHVAISLQTEIEPDLQNLEPILTDWLNARLYDEIEAAENNLTIEFILPRRLINWPVERLRFEQGGDRVELGILYPVVVRPLWRLTKRDMTWPWWQQKWRDLPTNGAEPLFCCHATEHEEEHFIYRLIDKKVVCLVLTFAPVAHPADEKQDVLARCVAAGTPAAVWVRAELPLVQDLRDRLRAIVASLDKLPERIHIERGRAARSSQREQDLGAHLALLWDDADRVPPGSVVPPLRPPSSTGVL